MCSTKQWFYKKIITDFFIFFNKVYLIDCPDVYYVFVETITVTSYQRIILFSVLDGAASEIALSLFYY